MAQRTLTLALPLLLAIQGPVSALQVTPNSPCATVCIDNSNLDTSDPNSSNTHNADITCEDASFAKATGQKWESCMSCLQNSTFYQGPESDQGWFLCKPLKNGGGSTLWLTRSI